MTPLNATDRQFLKHFAMLIGALHVVAFGLIAIATTIYAKHPAERSPVAGAAVRQRIEPVGAVYVGETGRAAALAAQQAQSKGAAAPFGGSTDGKVVFDGLCQACHATGAAGAPKVGDAAAWKPRIAQGRDVLYQHALNGFQGKSGVMPPRGGNPALGDDQVKAAVDWIASQAK